VLSAPTLLTTDHQIDSFRCGVASLDDWLNRRAMQNQLGGTSRTYVVADGQRVVGYYALSSGALDLKDAPGPIKRNMPNPIPLALMGRIAVDMAWHGYGLGAALLQDAVQRTMQAGSILGIRGLLVHALSEPAKAFYEHHGFTASPTQPMTLILSLRMHG
jgi:ribosomal protein S18 acetylase RimI-like enzyme